MDNGISIDGHAARLYDAHARGERFMPFAGADAIPDIDSAYAIQEHFVARLLAARGQTVVGFKIGLTSPRMQALLGIDSPIAGHVVAGSIHDSGHTVHRAQFVNLGLECEIAVRLGRDLPPAAAPFTRDDVTAAVTAVCPAFELVDDRGADYAATDIASLVADNSWNAGLVLGEFRDAWPALELLEGIVIRNGVELDRGRGADVLGHPFVPLTWLANHLARGRRGLRAGDIVATGSMIPTRVPATDEHCVFSIPGLGDVHLHVRD